MSERITEGKQMDSSWLVLHLDPTDIDDPTSKDYVTTASTVLSFLAPKLQELPP